MNLLLRLNMFLHFSWIFAYLQSKFNRIHFQEDLEKESIIKLAQGFAEAR
jgi:hypothetical protein